LGFLSAVLSFEMRYCPFELYVGLMTETTLYLAGILALLGLWLS